MPNKEVIACIDITHFRMSLDGEHYYAKLIFDNNFIDLEYELSQKQATYLNKKDRCHSISAFKKGAKCKRFFEIEDIHKAAIKYCKEYFPQVKMILEGDYPSNPCKVVMLEDKKLKDTMNGIHEKMEEIYKITNDPWAYDEKLVDKLYEQWEQCLSLSTNQA